MAQHVRAAKQASGLKGSTLDSVARLLDAVRPSGGERGESDTSSNDPGDERAHGARLTRGSAASNDRTGTSLSSCSDLPLPPMAIKSSLLPF